MTLSTVPRSSAPSSASKYPDGGVAAEEASADPEAGAAADSAEAAAASEVISEAKEAEEASGVGAEDAGLLTEIRTGVAEEEAEEEAVTIAEENAKAVLEVTVPTVSIPETTSTPAGLRDSAHAPLSSKGINSRLKFS